MLTDAEILENRKKVIAWLRKPKLRKAKGVLRRSSGGRCCLGHMCDALGMPSTIGFGEVYHYGNGMESVIAPKELINSVGLFTSSGLVDGSRLGRLAYVTHRGKTYSGGSLASINDDTPATAADIADYLEQHIMGGSNAPWKVIKI